uniref:Na+/K+-exchanging ATPase alpha chain (Fragments) n=1 Tax=Canis lupus familiaris TaxID=9615 RepID=Q7M3H7_CANLF
MTVAHMWFDNHLLVMKEQPLDEELKDAFQIISEGNETVEDIAARWINDVLDSYGQQWQYEQR